MFGLGKIKMIGAALVVAFLLAGAAYVKGRIDGRHLGAVAALKAENRQWQQRSETDAEVDELDRYSLCVDLIGSVPDCDDFR